MARSSSWLVGTILGGLILGVALLKVADMLRTAIMAVIGGG